MHGHTHTHKVLKRSSLHSKETDFLKYNAAKIIYQLCGVPRPVPDKGQSTW